MITLGIDPGEKTGLAAYDSDKRELVWWHLGYPWDSPNLAFPRPHLVCVETPRIYPGGKTVNPNDIITLALTAGELIRWAKAFGVPVNTVHPQAWKGQIPKPKRAADPYIVQGRVQTRAQCKHWPEGTLAPSLAHNVYDAMGIAMHAAGHEIR